MNYVSRPLILLVLLKVLEKIKIPLPNIDFDAMVNDTIFGPESRPEMRLFSWWLNDGQAAAIVPVITYWSLCVLFETIEYFGLFKKFKIYPTEEEQKKNIAPKSQVIRYVMIQQTIQMIFALVMTSWENPDPIPDDAFGQTLYFRMLLEGSQALQPIEVTFLAWCLRLIYLAVRQFAAFLVFDAWSYFVHYVEHNNAYIYSKYSRMREFSLISLRGS